MNPYATVSTASAQYLFDKIAKLEKEIAENHRRIVSLETQIAYLISTSQGDTCPAYQPPHVPDRTSSGLPLKDLTGDLDR